MKNSLTVVLTILVILQINAQNKWFSTYSDQKALVADASKIVKQMKTKIHNANKDIKLTNNVVVKNTTPYLIYIYNDSINLPFWEEVIEPQKNFFTEVSGGEIEGKKVFGLFFNGFYVVHEMGHSIAMSTGKNFDNAFDSEYDANVFAILYWRTTNNKAKLEECYFYAKKILSKLQNPVPENENFKEYLTKHYEELSSDPYKYGYIQFSQFVEIYENKELPDFDTFIKNYLK